MRTAAVVVENPLRQNSSQVSFPDWNHKIQTPPPDGSHQALAVRIGHGCPYECPQHLQSECFQFLIDLQREDRIAVVDEKPIGNDRRELPPETAAEPIQL